MRGIYSNLTDIRRKVFTEVARLAYGGDEELNNIKYIPYKIIPGEIGTYRNDIFLERAIVSERVRLAMGLSLRPVEKPAPITHNIDDATQAEHYYEAPLINIIKYACNSCAEKRFLVSNGCQGCLAHPCREVCPKKAISFVDGHAFIDQSLCIKCGQCKNICPYEAIIKQERPCARACGMDAISSDEHGRATIDYDKCVSCGQCLVSCPFGAIADKSQIYQLIRTIKKGEKVIAAVAPAFVGQFGMKANSAKLRTAMKQLGFYDTVEVAVGADLCTIDEAHDFLKKVPAEQPFMATSCCPAWSMMAKKLFPQFASYISMALTPMVLTARLVKEQHPDAKIVFVGPCAAKKLEAMRRSVRSDVDFVLTFEEMAAIFAAKEIDLEAIEATEPPFSEASADGKGFAVSGGVAQAVVNLIKKENPDMQVNVAAAQGLKDCRKLLLMAKANKYNGYLLEGMACPGGCVAGAGTIQAISKANAMVNREKATTKMKNADETKFSQRLEDLITKYKDEEQEYIKQKAESVNQ